MKKMQIIIMIAFCTLSFGQKQEATLFFKDGTKIQGLAKLTEFGNKIRFRKKKGDKRVTYTSKEVAYLNIQLKVNVDLFNPRGDIRNATYYYKNIKNSEFPVLLELMEKGKVSLYRNLREGYSAPTFSGGGINGGATMTGGTSYSISNYYVCKENDDELTHLGTKGSIFSKNFKKAASSYFSGCPTLVNKIQSKEFRKRDIVAIVEFYNSNCK